MSFATTRFVHTSASRVPVLTPLYGARHESFRATFDGTYECGSGEASEFSLEFPGAEAAHCCFIREGSSFSVNRRNGRVWVNDLPVTGICRLSEGDVVSFGSVSFQLEFLDTPSSSPEPFINSLTSVTRPASISPRSAVDSSAALQQILTDSTASASVVPNASCQTALHQELLEHQRLLSIRQQQLEELTALVRKREQAADSRLAAIEDRSSHLTAQSNELASLREHLAAREREVIQRAEDTERQRQVLADQQRELATVAEQNSQSFAAAQQAQSELARQEAELLALREQTLAAQAELDGQKSELLQQQQEADRQRQLLADQQQELASVAEQNSQAFEAAQQAQSELARQEAELLATAESLTQQEAALAERAQSLQVAEQQSAARSSAIAETRSVEQLAAFAAQKEAAVRERQQAVAAQNELRQLQQSIEDRQSELQVWQSEIEARTIELSTRLAELKSYRREQRAALAAAAAEPKASLEDLELLEQQVAAIRTEREELDRRAAEIVADEERLAEQRASAASITHVAESERTALQNANKDLLCERNALSQLRQDLASRESGITEREVLVTRQLDDLRSRFAVLDLRAAEQKHFEAEIDSRAADVHRRIQQFKHDQQAHREMTRLEQTAEVAKVAADGGMEELLAIRQQLDTVQQELNARDDAHSAMTAERDSLMAAVRELQKALQDARQDVEEANRVKSESGLLEQRLEQAYQTCEERSRNLQSSDSKLLQINEQLESLRTELADSNRERDELLAKIAYHSESSNVASPNLKADTGASFDGQSRELDQRAELLDRRDDELCERARKLEQSESDIESQRRQLLEARQQLEQARAEIQVAIRQRSDRAPDAAATTHEASIDSSSMGGQQAVRVASSNADLNNEHESAESRNGTESAKNLRSELAGLFGLQKPEAENTVSRVLPQPDDTDLSEPTGGNKSIVFHFGPNAPKLVETDSAPAVEPDAEPLRAENSDEFVRDYMEQLLTRGRKTAGTVLPGELQSTEKKSDPAAAPAAKATAEPPKKTGPKVKSFIEQYMAGNMGSLESGEPLRSTEPVSEEKVSVSVEEPQVVVPRQKMDLQKLKQNMESFRTLSAQSVENALASHAIKVERTGFTGRSAFAAVLLTMTLVLGIANAQGAIDSPMLTWVMLTSAIAILSELYRRYTIIKVHTRNPLDLLFSSDETLGSIESIPDMMIAAPVPDAHVDSTRDAKSDVATLDESDVISDSVDEQQPWLMEINA